MSDQAVQNDDLSMRLPRRPAHMDAYNWRRGSRSIDAQGASLALFTNTALVCTGDPSTQGRQLFIAFTLNTLAAHVVTYVARSINLSADSRQVFRSILDMSSPIAKQM